jgi:hypothetical protein
MTRALEHMADWRRHWRVALLLLGLLASGTVQIAAATHWHRSGAAVVGTTDHSAPRAPVGDGNDRDGCLLCQVVAHAAAAAPPPAPWVLVDAFESGTISSLAVPAGIAVIRPSHAWQGRAPPRV